MKTSKFAFEINWPLLQSALLLPETKVDKLSLAFVSSYIYSPPGKISSHETHCKNVKDKGVVHKRRRSFFGHFVYPLPHVGILTLIYLNSTFLYLAAFEFENPLPPKTFRRLLWMAPNGVVDTLGPEVLQVQYVLLSLIELAVMNFFDSSTKWNYRKRLNCDES